MKNVIVKSIYAVAFLLITSVGFAHTTPLSFSSLQIEQLEMSTTNYSWTADANAVNYRIELTPSSLNQITLNSTTNSVDLSRIAPGNYDVVVIAEYASGSESIIIEDQIFV